MSLHPTAIVQPVQHWRKLSLSLTFGSPAKRSYRISSRAIFRVLRSAVFFFHKNTTNLATFRYGFVGKKMFIRAFFGLGYSMPSLSALHTRGKGWCREGVQKCANECENGSRVLNEEPGRWLVYVNNPRAVSISKNLIIYRWKTLEKTILDLT